ESLAARALEIEARGVHEHDVERGEQIPPAGEQLFLQNVLHAARRKRRGGILLIFGKLLAEPRHGAVEMMELEPADRFDAIVLAPAVGGAVRAAAEQAVQHGQKRRALQREVMLARPRQAFDHAPAARLLPHPLEGERRTDAPGRDRRPLAAVERVEHDCSAGEARPRAQKPLQLPALLQILDPSERRDHLLAHRGALAPALDDLQIGATAGGLLAEIHGGKPDTDSILVRTASAYARTKSTEIARDVALHFSARCPSPAIISIPCTERAGSNCRRSVRLSRLHALLRQDQKEQVHGQAEDASQAPGPKAEGHPRRNAAPHACSRAGAASVAVSSAERSLSVLRRDLQLSINARVQGLRRQAVAQSARQTQPKGPHELGDLPPAAECLP